MCPPAVVAGDGNIVNENNREKGVYLHFSYYPEATPSVPSPLFLFPWDKTNKLDETLLWKTLLETIQSYYF
jgi:hypothetical protein